MNLSPAMKASKAKMLRRRIAAAEADLSAAHDMQESFGLDELTLAAAARAATKLVELEAELESLAV